MAHFLPILVFLALSFWQVLGGEYVVYPEDGRDVSACTITTNFLNELLYTLNVQACVVETREVTQLWIIHAEDSDVERIMKQPGVKDVLENKIITKSDGQPVGIQLPTGEFNATLLNSTSATTYPKGRVIRQQDAPPDLAVVSWPPQKRVPKPKRGGMGGYYYDVLAGVDKYIYVIDHGINEELPDFQNMPYKPTEWIWTPGVLQTRRDNDPKEHGSCVASKAAGFVNGVSKNSRLVIVKTSHTMADTEWAFSKIYDDIVRKGRQKSAVILYARSSTEVFHSDSPLPTYWSSVQRLMHDLFILGVHIVTSAGNDAKRSSVFDTIPAIWNDILPIIVVGAVTIKGETPPFSQGIFLDGGLVYAPGVDVQCAGGSKVQIVNGTSAAAGLVAGVVAYYLGKTSTKDPLAMRAFIEGQSRYIVGNVDASPLIVWNGEQNLRFST